MVPATKNTTESDTGRHQFYFDGWYMDRADAEDCLEQCVRMGATPVGLVENWWDSWGIAYFSERVLFSNHSVRNGHNAIFAPLRKRED